MNAEAYVHIVMDAYHGDVVTLPGQLIVVEGPAGGSGDADPGASGRHTMVTVRVEAGAALPVQPEADGWHLRFIGTRRALDARSSDGTLAELRWEEHALTARVSIGDIIRDLDVEPEVAARRVTHVLVVPERSRE